MDLVNLNLSSDMLIKIFSYLPSPECLRCRAVCKGWKDIIDTPECMKFCSEVWIDRPWFLLSERSELDAVHVYDLLERKWYSFPLYFLPKPVYSRAAAGGLLCVEQREESFFKALYVCDPLTQTWMKLPPMIQTPFWGARTVKLMLDDFFGAYKVLVGCNHQLQVYDSLSTSWQSLGKLPIVSTVLCKPKRTLYSVAPSPGFDIVPKPYQLLSFNLDDWVWKPQVIRMPRCLTSPRLAESGDYSRIVMVGGVWRENMVRSLRIWELNLEEDSWDLVAKVPDHYRKQLMAGNWNTACAWSGEWIAIATSNRVLAYNVNNGEWVLSPPCAVGIKHGDHMSIFPFRPTFRGPQAQNFPK